ncbi:hypothetical protein EVB78_149 [Rhizobium phage RHph_N1_15]|nr:hypothetical protein EVB77_149 [Rhizobium phage RHph_N1_10]QIG69351.1 hypothetical protein EVB78_149 [Rhizobium phage RHph_N1_15]QIG75211.1 hypothetical protein EVC15_149 [Rhizobium phage RHph_N2_6]
MAGKRYFVTWEIDVEDADSPEDAARIAAEIMQRPGTTANVFKVIEFDSTGEAVTVDLEEVGH